MGMSLNVAIIQNCKKDEAKKAIERLSEKFGIGAILDEFEYLEFEKGVSILFGDYFVRFERIAETISLELGYTVMLLYIYDEDIWGYFFYEKGKLLDSFSPIPDIVGEMTEEEYKEMAGDIKLISKYFNVEEEKINKYIVDWNNMSEENFDEKAYEDDEFEYGNCWQVVDFMRSIGYPYLFEEDEDE